MHGFTNVRAQLHSLCPGVQVQARDGKWNNTHFPGYTCARSACTNRQPIPCHCPVLQLGLCRDLSDYSITALEAAEVTILEKFPLISGQQF